jgi:hypothetical protein
MRYSSGSEISEEEEGAEPTVKNGYSSSLGRIKIISGEDFAKAKNEETMRYVGIAAVLLLPAIYAFFALSKSSAASKNEKAPKKKR